MITPKLPPTVFCRIPTFINWGPSVCPHTNYKYGDGGGGGVSKHWSDNDTWRMFSCHDDGGDISLIASCVSTVCNQRRSCVSPRTIISRDLQRGGVQVAAPPRPAPAPARVSWCAGDHLPSVHHSTDIMTFMGTIASTHHCCTATALPSSNSSLKSYLNAVWELCSL